MKRLHGIKDLVIAAVDETTQMAQDGHDSTSERVFGLLRWIPSLRPAVDVAERVERLSARAVYGSIRLTNQAVGAALGRGFEMLGEPPVKTQASLPPRSDAVGSAAWYAESALGAVNGVVGDYLKKHDNPLAIEMALWAGGKLLPLEPASMARVLPKASNRICVFIHGLACTEWSWSFGAERHHGDAETSYATLLEQQLGYTCLHVRYNTGLHISDNGSRLAALLDRLVENYPSDIEQIVLIGHSMGGLVARSASHAGAEGGQPWVASLRHVFCLGSPHLGAPLEKAGHALAHVLGRIDLPAPQIISRVLNARSDGIKDLRYGYITEEEWRNANPDALLDDQRRQVPFVDHVGYYFIAASWMKNANHPVAQLVGDTLVRLPSASGQHPDAARRVPFELEHGAVIEGVSHVGLSNHPAVYAQIKHWCDCSATPS